DVGLRARLRAGCAVPWLCAVRHPRGLRRSGRAPARAEPVRHAGKDGRSGERGRGHRPVREILCVSGNGMTQHAIDRAFVRIEEGLVHYRRLAGEGHPLMMFHPSPNSSRGLMPVMQALRSAGCRADMHAIDTLGNGDSAPPRPDLEAPGIEYFADAMARVMDALGLDSVDLYGMHTGARIA